MDDKPSFTPGPWACQTVDKEGPDYGVTIVGLRLNDDGQPMETPTNGIVGAALPLPTEIDSGGYSRVEANAHLMASAPELYAQLEFAVKLLDALPGFRGTAQIDRMHAALAKARGEA